MKALVERAFAPKTEVRWANDYLKKGINTLQGGYEQSSTALKS